jgi:hypothetical protein
LSLKRFNTSPNKKVDFFIAKIVSLTCFETISKGKDDLKTL